MIRKERNLTALVAMATTIATTTGEATDAMIIGVDMKERAIVQDKVIRASISGDATVTGTFAGTKEGQNVIVANILARESVKIGEVNPGGHGEVIDRVLWSAIAAVNVVAIPDHGDRIAKTGDRGLVITENIKVTMDGN